MDQILKIIIRVEDNRINIIIITIVSKTWWEECLNFQKMIDNFHIWMIYYKMEIIFKRKMILIIQEKIHSGIGFKIVFKIIGQVSRWNSNLRSL